MKALRTSEPLDTVHLRLLDDLSDSLMRTLDSGVRIKHLLAFAVANLAPLAHLWLQDEMGMIRQSASAGLPQFQTDPPLEFELSAHGKLLGSLRLHKPHERATAEPAFLRRFAALSSYALYNSQAFEREQLVSLTFQNEAIRVALPRIPGVQFDAVYEAGRAEALVGGDWYDAFVLGDGRFVVSVGDVAGSGLNAAVTMVNVRQTLRGVAYVHADPILMLQAAEGTLRSQYPDRFVTAFVAVIDPVTQTCSYVNAGHPHPLLRMSDGFVRELGGGALPLGLHEFDSNVQARQTTLPPDCLLVLYTDGLTEASRDLLEGEQRVREAVIHLDASAPHPARDLHDAVLPYNANDDVAILTMHFSAPAPVQRWRFDPRWPDVSRRARSELLHALRAGGLDDDAAYNAEVILAELIANLIRYAHGVAELVLEHRGPHFILHVIDKGPGFQFSPRLPSDLFSERGRGLFLVSQLAQDFTVEHQPGGGSHARVVLKCGGTL